MLIYSSSSLHYPITVKDLLFKPDDAVPKLAPLFSYEYKTTVTEGNKYGEEKQVEKTLITRYESETEGTLVGWKIRAGAVIERAGLPLAEIQVPCRHDVQFGGMCADCGKDMTEIDFGTVIPDNMRANINMAHGNTALRITEEEAWRVESSAKKRLLESRKLSLVVDLDQTIIHATVDPTVGDWMEDTSNPNYDSVKDVHKFQLTEEGPGRGCWYYVKMRPGLALFLENISKLYELHIYTMGTRAYADQIARIVDPDRKIFGDRILSRDESGSLTAKSLQRLFPVDTKMVVIIDDRGDVWDWSKSLVKVVAYDFFKGIGDINSSFLPKRLDIVSQPDEPAPAPKDSSESNGKTDEELRDLVGSFDPDQEKGNEKPKDAEASTVDKLVSMGGANDPAAMKERVTEQDEQLAAQIADRPLLQEQLKLEKAEAAEEQAEAEEHAKAAELMNEATDDAAIQVEQADHAPMDDSIESPKPKHNLLQDNDTELEVLTNALTMVHDRFYDAYLAKVSGSVGGGRLAELKGEKSPKKRPDLDMSLVPDVQQIMPEMKSKALKGCTLVFSGVIPIGVMPQIHDYGRWAASFGAVIENDVSKRTTHVIGQPTRETGKMRVAARHKRIKIVTIDWLYNAWATWQRPDETPFLIDVEPGKPRKAKVNGDGPAEDPATDEDSESSEGYETPLQMNEDESGLRILIPSLHDEESGSMSSPIDDDIDEIDWGELGDEFDDSDMEDSELDTPAPSQNGDGRKRKRRGGTETDSESNADGNESDRSAKGMKSRKRATARTSSLKQVTTMDESEDGAGDPLQKDGGKDMEEEGGGGGGGGGREKPLARGYVEEEGENDSDDSDADFAAELERQMAED